MTQHTEKNRVLRTRRGPVVRPGPKGGAQAARTRAAEPPITDQFVARLPDGPKRYIAAKPVARFVPNLTKKAFQKYGFASAALVAEWADIVGSDLAKQCVPEKLSQPRTRRHDAGGGSEDTKPGRSRPDGSTLVLRTDAAFALEIEYASAQIIERINAYFGYRAVAALKIIQGPLPAQPTPDAVHRRRPPTSPSQAATACSDAISKIENPELKAALTRMQTAVFEGR